MEFIYTAITKDGHKETASIQAPNLAVAGHLLKEQGLLPTHIEEQNKKNAINRTEDCGILHRNTAQTKKKS